MSHEQKCKDMKKIRVFLAEDHHVVRVAICALLNREPDIEVVGEVAEGSKLIAEVGRLKPDILLMDAQMPNHKPVEATEKLCQKEPETNIVVLSAYDLQEYVVGLLRAGAIGYVLKDDPSEMLVQAIRAAAEGREWISPQVARILIESVRNSHRGVPDQLTDRELEVLQWMARGRTNTEIAEELVISEHTVKNHVTNIFRKLDLETRVEAVLYAISAEIVSTREIKDEFAPD